MALDGAYDPLPDPPLCISGTVISFDGATVRPDGAYLFDNDLINEYQNTFPGYIVGWPDTDHPAYSNYVDQNSIVDVPRSFIA